MRKILRHICFKVMTFPINGVTMGAVEVPRFSWSKRKIGGREMNNKFGRFLFVFVAMVIVVLVIAKYFGADIPFLDVIFGG